MLCRKAVSVRSKRLSVSSQNSLRLDSNHKGPAGGSNCKIVQFWTITGKLKTGGRSYQKLVTGLRPGGWFVTNQDPGH